MGGRCDKTTCVINKAALRRQLKINAWRGALAHQGKAWRGACGARAREQNIEESEQARDA